MGSASGELNAGNTMASRSTAPVSASRRNGPRRFTKATAPSAFSWTKKLRRNSATPCSRSVRGAAGGLPFEILATTFSTLLEPRFVPFEFNLDGLQSSARLGDELRIALEPIKNPVTGDPEQVAVNHGTGFIFKQAECASAREGAVAIDEMNFSYPDKAGFVARIHYEN